MQHLLVLFVQYAVKCIVNKCQQNVFFIFDCMRKHLDIFIIINLCVSEFRISVNDLSTQYIWPLYVWFWRACVLLKRI